jgi:phosphoribulokinase
VITGSSGAGTSTVRTTFEEIFRREGVTPVIVEGDAFHRYDRENMQQKMIEKQRQGYAKLHMSAVFRDAGQLPARADRRHLQPVYRAAYPKPG